MDISWINGGGGLFSTVSNWSDIPNLPDRAPGPNDIARFGLTAPPSSFQRVYTVSFVTNPTNQAFVVEDDRVTFNLNGHVYNLTFLDAIHVGTSSSALGRLTIINGTVAAANNAIVRIGFTAAGFINVGSGGLLVGSLMDLRVGNGGFGSLTIENNGDVIVDEVDVGFANFPGEAVVTGGGSTLLANALTIGVTGLGQLHVTSGGIIETASSIVGDSGLSGHGIVTVQGPGSRWTAGKLTVGRLADGELNIVEGGRVTCTAALLSSSQNPGAMPGTVTVAGAGSTFEVNGRLDVAFTGSGQGKLRIQPGGSVRVTQDTQIGFRGLIQLEGGTLQTPAIIFENSGSGASDAFQWTSGTLHVGSFLGDLVNCGGILAPGASAGSTTIEGDYKHGASATLEIEIGGTVPGTQHDLVNVIGNVLLEGSLKLDLLNGFSPSAADVFTILGTGGGFTGSFTNVANGQRLSTSDGAGSFVVNYGAGSVLDPLKVMLTGFRAGLPGDYNFNGIVDAADYTVWRNNLGSPTALPNDDTPGVGQDDYDRWNTHFGQTAGSGATGSAGAFSTVPEPTAILMALCASLFTPLCARRRPEPLRNDLPSRPVNSLVSATIPGRGVAENSC